MWQELDAALTVIRPILQQDGGDIELVEITADNVVRIRLTGRCKGCPRSQQTLQSVVRRTILKMAPGVKAVEAVE